MPKKLQLVRDALVAVFRRPSGIMTAAVFSLLGLFVAVWITNLPLLKEVLFGSRFGLGAKLEILVTSLGAIESNFHAFSRTITLAIVFLFGINVAMVVHYLRDRFALDRAAGTGIAGTIVGMLGVGCASCGSVLVSALFGSGVVALLPLHGVEFGLFGIAILLVSIYLAAKKISRPETCAIPS